MERSTPSCSCVQVVGADAEEVCGGRDLRGHGCRRGNLDHGAQRWHPTTSGVATPSRQALIEHPPDGRQLGRLGDHGHQDAEVEPSPDLKDGGKLVAQRRRGFEKELDSAERGALEEGRRLVAAEVEKPDGR